VGGTAHGSPHRHVRYDATLTRDGVKRKMAVIDTLVNYEVGHEFRFVPAPSGPGARSFSEPPRS
jgi:hypothetical protein